MNWLSEDFMPKREEGKLCKEGTCTGRGVSSKVGRLPAQGELLRKIMEIHLSFSDIPFPFFLPFLTYSFIIFHKYVLHVISGA